MKPVYIIDALRTPIGRYGGNLSSVRADDLSSLVIKELILRHPDINPNDIEDVIWGDANQAGEDNRNVARMATLLAGLPVSVAGCTVNRLCASGMQAIMDASRAIMCGEGNVYIAGGCESMSRAPFVIPKADSSYSRNAEIYDTTIGWRFTNKKLTEKYYPYSMGETAGNVAKQWSISREDQDRFAFESQNKYQKAWKEGKFKDEIIPVIIKDKKGDIIIDKDEHPRETTLEKLNALPPVFKGDNTVTAGNSSGINDGAAGLLLCSEDYLLKLKTKPLAKIVSMAVAGVEPSIMGIGPVPATKKAMHRAGLKISDIDLVELNEAFASQSLACIRDLGIDPEKVNVNGGAIALGHPLGCTGARISVTLLHELKRHTQAKYGLATLCVGVGQGAAIIYEKV